MIWEYFPKFWFSFADDEILTSGESVDPSEETAEVPGAEAAGVPTEVSTEDEGKSTDPSEYEVKVDGEVLKVPLNELLSGYQRQSDYTRKTQELAETKREIEHLKRDADAFRSMQNDPRYSQPQKESMKDQFVKTLTGRYKDIDPEFLGTMADFMEKVADSRATQMVKPISQAQGMEFERRFLESHSDVTPGSPEYKQIASYIQQGADPEKAYSLVFQDSIVQKKIDKAIKDRDEEAKRKLKGSPTKSKTGTKPVPKTWDEVKEAALAKFNL